MRVLVTGGAGFIGSHLVDALLARGDSVVVLDDLSSGSISNLKNHVGSPALRFIRGDVRDAETVEKALADVDAVIHEAAIVSIPFSIENPELVKSVNVGGTITLLEESRGAGVKRFVYASTSAVYGEQARMPVSEEAPSNPISPYAESKLEAEMRCRDFFKRFGLKTVCLRYFNVYGPRQTGGEYAGVMVKFAERLREGKPPIIHGDGEQTRDFVHVQDAVRASLLALGREGVAGEVLNVGTGRATSINGLCSLFSKISRKYFEPIHEASRAGDIRHSQADISKAKRLLGFEPKISLEEGVEGLFGSLGKMSEGCVDENIHRYGQSG